MQSHFSLQRQDSKSPVPLEQTLGKHSQHTVLAQIPHKLAGVTKILPRHGIPISVVNTTWGRVWILGTRRSARPEARAFLEELEVDMQSWRNGFSLVWLCR